jgi:hypothetical protein
MLSTVAEKTDKYSDLQLADAMLLHDACISIVFLSFLGNR